MTRKKEARRLYYIEHYTAVISEPLELYTWEDACDVVDSNRHLHPERELMIREFEI